jgi:hypothetical protein
VDNSNRFRVCQTGQKNGSWLVQVRDRERAGMPMTRDEAVNLAAWLIALAAEDGSELEEELAEVKRILREIV